MQQGYPFGDMCTAIGSSPLARMVKKARTSTSITAIHLHTMVPQQSRSLVFVLLQFRVAPCRNGTNTVMALNKGKKMLPHEHCAMSRRF
jgi:hypothetical protein